ncbi:MAG: hypothetical protein ACYC9L_06160 [Sulfuricaulis sp.]
MYEVDTTPMSEAFFACWRDAGIHLNRKVDGGIRTWLRSNPTPPFLEHLSFRLGNQLFFIRIEDVEDKVRGPGSLDGLDHVTSEAKGLACILPMRNNPRAGCWVPHLPGWGILDAHTHLPIDPVALVTDEKIEMTPWEVQDMAVQIVRDDLFEKGFELMSWVGNPGVNPSIWFIGASQKPEWVVVRSARYPEKAAPRPANWKAIADVCAKLSTRGHFASVSIASAEQHSEANGEPIVPLWRGHAMCVQYAGLQSTR